MLKKCFAYPIPKMENRLLSKLRKRDLDPMGRKATALTSHIRVRPIVGNRLERGVLEEV
jgi:hypothetical protein